MYFWLTGGWAFNRRGGRRGGSISAVYGIFLGLNFLRTLIVPCSFDIHRSYDMYVYRPIGSWIADANETDIVIKDSLISINVTSIYLFLFYV